MLTYSTCTDCGERLHVAVSGQTTHPLCEPEPPSEDQRITTLWLKALLDEDMVKEASLRRQLDKIDTEPPRLGEAALWYARWGWPVFPLVKHQKRPATSNGFKDATTDPAQIRAWWDQWPQGNIGLATGHLFDVIDIDMPEGASTLAMLESKENLVIHGRVSTARGGVHLYVAPTGQGNKARMFDGLDYRGAGGYVVAPPSTLGAHWQSWVWTVKPSPDIKAAAGER